MKRQSFFGSLSFQIGLAISIIVVTAVVLLGLLVTYLSRASILDEKRRLGQAMASLVQQSLSRPTEAELAAGNTGMKLLAERVSEHLYDSRFIHSISFYDNTLSVIYSTLPNSKWPYSRVFTEKDQFPLQTVKAGQMKDPASGKEMLVFSIPWRVSGVPIGKAILVEPVTLSNQQFFFTGKLVVAFALFYAFIVIVFGVIILQQTIVRPIRTLTKAVKRLNHGERNIELRVKERNELGDLAISFNEMAARLSENEQHMSDQIEELLEVNDELEQTRRSLIRQEKLASIGKLSAGVAHEVGNPLSAILGYVDLLQKGGLDEEITKDFLVRIENDISRINTIIRGLLDYSRQHKEKIEVFDINELIGDTVELLRLQKPFKRIEFDIQSHHKPANVEADKNQLQQVLINLFINAGQAMDEEGQITVFLEQFPFDRSLTYRERSNRFKQGEELISVSVIDQGQGMTQEAQERIFDPFFTTKEPGKGTGLGLSVSEKIIDSFGGTIDVVSQPDVGATFTILLPEYKYEMQE